MGGSWKWVESADGFQRRVRHTRDMGASGKESHGAATSVGGYNGIKGAGGERFVSAGSGVCQNIYDNYVDICE